MVMYRIWLWLHKVSFVEFINVNGKAGTFRSWVGGGVVRYLLPSLQQGLGFGKNRGLPTINGMPCSFIVTWHL